MSKSLDRVIAALRESGLDIHPVEAETPTRTAAEAAAERGCETDQIGKSIVFTGAVTSQPLLFLTSGSRRVDPQLGAALAGEPLARADAATIRAHRVRDRRGFTGGASDTAARVDRQTSSRLRRDLVRGGNAPP